MPQLQQPPTWHRRAMARRRIPLAAAAFALSATTTAHAAPTTMRWQTGKLDASFSLQRSFGQLHSRAGCTWREDVSVLASMRYSGTTRLPFRMSGDPAKGRLTASAIAMRLVDARASVVERHVYLLDPAAPFSCPAQPPDADPGLPGSCSSFSLPVQAFVSWAPKAGRNPTKLELSLRFPSPEKRECAGAQAGAARPSDVGPVLAQPYIVEGTHGIGFAVRRSASKPWRARTGAATLSGRDSSALVDVNTKAQVGTVSVTQRATFKVVRG